MGYSVYWANGRWQGYGVPAYCDYPGCREKIDRGMGYQHYDEGEEYPNIFCCEKHRNVSMESFEPESKEHFEWIEHISNDKAWKEWRESKDGEILKEWVKELQKSKPI